MCSVEQELQFVKSMSAADDEVPNYMPPPPPTQPEEEAPATKAGQADIAREESVVLIKIKRDDKEDIWKEMTKESAIFAMICGCCLCSIPALVLSLRKPADDLNEEERIKGYKISCLLSLVAILTLVIIVTTLVLVQLNFQII